MKREKKSVGHSLWMAILAVMAALLLFPMAGNAMEGQTVRVAVFPLGQFQYFDSNGHAAGYNIEYLEKIAQTTHWQYQYVAAENFQDACAKLEAGEVDLVAPAQQKDYLAQKFDYSAYTMATECGAVYVLNKEANQNLLFEDFESMGKMTVAAVKYESSSFTQRFEEEYMVQNHFSPVQITYYNNMTEVLEALRSGQVDAAVTNILFQQDDLKLIGRFAPMPSYYLVQKGAAKLRTELDQAMTNILLNAPSFQTDLMSEYFTIYGDSRFTYEEREFIDSMQTITIGYQTNHSPLSYTDEETGEFAGITRDILDKIAEFSGLAFQYVALPPTGVSADYLNEQGISVISNVEYNDRNKSSAGMNLSKPYLYSEKVFVAKEGFQFDNKSTLTLALATGSASIESVIQEEYPNFTFREYATVEECFEAVDKGETDLFMDNRYVVEVLLAKPKYQNFSVIPVQGMQDQLCVSTFNSSIEGTNAAFDADSFISIMDKCIDRITEQELNEIIINNVYNQQYQLTFGDFAYQYRWTLTVESEKGKGSTFTVDMPFGVCEQEKVGIEEKLKSVRALVVDDDKEAAMYVSTVLDRIGVEHDMVNSGEEAIFVLQEEYEKGSGYDVCFVDWRMPGMSGIDVTQKIRAMYGDDTLVIIASAYDLSEVEDEARMAGANYFVTKPLFQSTVFNVLMMLSGGKYKNLTANAFTEDVTAALESGMNGHIAKPIDTQVLYSTLAKVIGGEE